MWRAFLPLLFAAFVSAETVPHGTLSLISGATALKAGGESLVGLEFALDPGWHIYWANPGDSGVQPRVRWTASAGVHMRPLLWPAPSRLEDHGLMDFGYRNRVVLLAPVFVAAGGFGEAQITADVHWAVCSETCVMARATIAKRIPIAATPVLRTSETEIVAEAERELPKPLPANCAPVAWDEKNLFDLRLSCSELASPLAFFPLDPSEIENAAPQRETRQNGRAVLALVKSDQLLRAPMELRGVLETGNGGPAYQIVAPVKNSK